MERDGTSWAGVEEHDKGIQAGKRGFYCDRVQKRSLLLLDSNPVIAFCHVVIP